MIKTLLVVALSTGLTLSACARKKSAAPETTTRTESPSAFDASINEAKEILGKTDLGKKVVADLDNRLKEKQVVKINPVTQEERKKNNETQVGGIKRLSPGTYEIWLGAELKGNDLAHALAHEVVHVSQSIEQDVFLENNKPIKDKLIAGHKLLKAGHVDENKASEKENADLALLSTLFQEAQAFQVNLVLDKQGIPLNEPKEVKVLGLQKYLEAVYIPSSINPPAAAAQIEEATNRFNTVTDFQKHIIAESTPEI